MTCLKDYVAFENKFILRDLQEIIEDKKIPWEELKGKNILVTGATGLLGSLIAKSILLKDCGAKVGVLVRNTDKLKNIFGPATDMLLIENGDLLSDTINLKHDYQYILHTACPTASKSFVDNPVEVIEAIVNGTTRLLKLSQKKVIKNFLFLSSMEVYGRTHNVIKQENDDGVLDHLSVRNCYPVAKRMAENLCRSFYHEYGISTKIVRLTQTFGPGVSKDDGRVFAQFARSIINNEDIILCSKGLTERDYLYTSDAVRKILSVMLMGKDGEVYNISNPETFCSIYEMAQLCCKIANDKIKIKFNFDENEIRKYLGEIHIQLDNSKVNELNNFPMKSLNHMLTNLASYMRELK